MKIRLLSDLHLEGYQYKYTPLDEDVLVIAGDIHTKGRHSALICQVPEYIRVIFVAGNHEYYHGEFHQVNRELKALEQKYPNFTFLNNESTTIRDVEFFGGTMFTDFALNGHPFQSMAMVAAQFSVNDFRMIKIEENGKQRPWTPNDHLKQFEIFRDQLRNWIAHTNDKKRVVVSHFAPHPVTIARQYVGDPLSPYFTADMNNYIGWDGLWLFGHTHTSHDRLIGDTRFVANPRGYGNENARNFDNRMILEI